MARGFTVLSQIHVYVVGSLQQERERQGLSLKKLGTLSGISRTAIGMIEKGQRSPSLTVCLRIADALGLRMEDLLTASRKARL